MRADMVAAYLDYRDTGELARAVVRAEMTEDTPLEALKEYLAARPDLKERETELLEYARPLIEAVGNQPSAQGGSS